MVQDFTVAKGHGKVLYSSARKAKRGDGFEHAAYEKSFKLMVRLEEAVKVKRKYRVKDWTHLRKEFKRLKKLRKQKQEKDKDKFSMDKATDILTKNLDNIPDE